ncbi:P-loop containing nucleoside triphosphate hydrolase protein [Cladorrhinum samala]|uniref:ATP-dependent DNA helicase n=1 Tax=Cladorrhinum samala TaxID=585594 RepID=A0AAV9HVL5_9PEZI|nr:P-loop containing nucleoside triphosphate hydrolase protein [Cladorrhinum samala]
MAKRKKAYAVCRGRRPGIFDSYSGAGGAEEQVKGFSRPCFMGAVAQLPPLCDEQQDVVKHAKSGRNIFFTGSAGCGKSTVLHTLRKELEDMGKQVHVMAPTGIVAIAINGVTTYNFAGWNPDHDRSSLVNLVSPDPDDTYGEDKMKELRLKRLSEVDVIIVDEISMVDHNMFQRLDFLMKAARDSDEPFGGVQVIVTGDFFQLPPVRPFKHCYACGTEFEPGVAYNQKSWPRECESCDRQFSPEDQYAFRSDAWKQCDFVCIYLKKVHRQKDAHFVSLLQKCRSGTLLGPADVALLSRSKPREQREKALKLYPRKDTVNRINREAFEEIDAPEVFYPCYDRFFLKNDKHDPDGRYRQYYADTSDGPYSGTLRQLRDHRWEPKLYLKQGMRVMLLHNLDIEGRLCNGSQGEVIDFVPNDQGSEKYNPKDISGAHAWERAKAIRAFIEICEADVDFPGWPRVRFDNGKEETIYPECTANEVGSAGTKPYSLLCRAQVPLTAGYAISIHKSQGMTLDNVMVDLGSAFQQEQIYVAMSRARSLDGLEVQGLEKAQYRLLKWREKSDVVKEFYREQLGVT